MLEKISSLGLLVCLLWAPAVWTKSDTCFMSMDVGNCEASIKRYFYNYTSDVCEEFRYGGCGGNKNNFKTLSSCQMECTNICKLPKDTKPCIGQFPKYYFNTMTGTCEPFAYGGCESNANNFETMDDCKRKCPDVNMICMEPLDEGQRTENYDIRWSFDRDQWSCSPFIYLGKGGNQNNFQNRLECKESCPIGDICMLPPDTGPCSASEKRWNYDVVSGECLEFDYGGCLGNKNNFMTKPDCQLRCPEQSICNLPKAGEFQPADEEKGRDREKIKPLDRFYYDPERETCRYFRYTGSDGNANNFDTVTKCNLHCPVMNKCAKPMNRGTSTDYSLKWYYNVNEMECADFIYYGKGGNDNRFLTKRDCQDDCGGCKQKKDRGPCLGFNTRWYYDYEGKKCRTFVFGGCRGNSNNFEKMEDCIQKCVS